MASPLQDLFSQNVTRTADGRYFLPFKNTASYTVAPTDPNFTNYDDYFWNFDPAQGPGVFGSGRQDAFALDKLDASSRGSYGGDLGYFFNDNNIVGAHPATTSGSRPNENGLWQALSLIAPAAGGIIGAAGADAGAVGADAGAGDISGSVGDSTLMGGSGTDTLAGGSTDNYFGDYLSDPETGDVVSSNPDPYGTGVDQYGNPTGQFSDGGFTGDTTNTGYNYDFSSDPNYADLAKKYGSTIAKQIVARAKGAAGGNPSLGQSVLGQLSDDPLSAAFSATPFLLALREANKQGGDINDTIGRMRSLEDSVSGNASPYMNALLNPYDQQTGTGRAALVQDQGLRGIRGSSFGDQSLNSYDYTRDLGRGDIASKALLGSAGLQGNLLNSELGAINARNTNRNLLLGAGLSASGRLFQPQQDPFNLKTLLGLT